VLQNVWVANTSNRDGDDVARVAEMGLLSPWPSVVWGKLPAGMTVCRRVWGRGAHPLVSSLLSPLSVLPLAPSSPSAFSLLLPSLLAVRTLSVIVIVLAVLVIHVFVS